MNNENINNYVSDISNLAKESVAIQTVIIDGFPYYRDRNGELRLVKKPVLKDFADRQDFGDLHSIFEMVMSEKNKFTWPIYVHVIDERNVEVFTGLDGEKDRERPYRATCEGSKFRFGQWYNYEDFVIALRSQFIQNEDMANLLAALRNISHVENVEVEDDGITQKVTAQSGQSLAKKTEVAPIRKLIPYRTFIELEQPKSEFLLRLNDNGQFALFEADGGAWKRKAKNSAIKYFEFQFSLTNVAGEVIILG